VVAQAAPTQRTDVRQRTEYELAEGALACVAHLDELLGDRMPDRTLSELREVCEEQRRRALCAERAVCDERFGRP
jgi:hypothetical protein